MGILSSSFMQGHDVEGGRTWEQKRSALFFLCSVESLFATRRLWQVVHFPWNEKSITIQHRVISLTGVKSEAIARKYCLHTDHKADTAKTPYPEF